MLHLKFPRSITFSPLHFMLCISWKVDCLWDSVQDYHCSQPHSTVYTVVYYLLADLPPMKPNSGFVVPVIVILVMSCSLLRFIQKVCSIIAELGICSPFRAKTKSCVGPLRFKCKNTGAVASGANLRHTSIIIGHKKIMPHLMREEN